MSPWKCRSIFPVGPFLCFAIWISARVFFFRQFVKIVIPVRGFPVNEHYDIGVLFVEPDSQMRQFRMAALPVPGIMRDSCDKASPNIQFASYAFQSLEFPLFPAIVGYLPLPS